MTQLSPPTSSTISILIKPGPARRSGWRAGACERRAGARGRGRGSGGDGEGGGEGGGSAQTRTRTRAHTDTHSGDARPRAHTQRQLAFLPGFLPVCSAPDRPLAAARGRPHRAEAWPGRRRGQRGPRAAAAAHARPVPARGGHRDSAGPPAAGDVKMSVGCACPGEWGARSPGPSLPTLPRDPHTPCLARTCVGVIPRRGGGQGYMASAGKVFSNYKCAPAQKH